MVGVDSPLERGIMYYCGMVKRVTDEQVRQAVRQEREMTPDVNIVIVANPDPAGNSAWRANTGVTGLWYRDGEYIDVMPELISPTERAYCAQPDRIKSGPAAGIDPELGLLMEIPERMSDFIAWLRDNRR